MKTLTKKVRRELSADESLRRYFCYLERHLVDEVTTRGRILAVERERGNVLERLQIRRVVDTGQGLVIRVT